MNNYFFIFDVESIGLHGEGFAVAGGVWDSSGKNHSEFLFACPPDNAEGRKDDREWIAENVAEMPYMFDNPRDVRLAFWNQWEAAKLLFPGIVMAAECLWPVEARFICRCIEDDGTARIWSGPYPFHEIASIMLSAGMDPMETYARLESEQPPHHPMADVRLSARLLSHALQLLADINEGPDPILDTDYDPTPYCSHCGARESRFCDCGPISKDD